MNIQNPNFITVNARALVPWSQRFVSKFPMLVREQGVKQNQQGYFAEYRMATKC